MIINLPLTLEYKKKLKAGDLVYLNGTIYTARDAAHQKIKDFLNKGISLPIDLRNSVIYYAGPTPTKDGQIIGSIGPTTSTRMDSFMSMMDKLGVSATIGKGPRSIECFNYAKDKYMIYFAATGGIGALLSKCVTKCEVVAFEELGCESIKKLEINNFPVIVAYDIYGNDIYRR